MKKITLAGVAITLLALGLAIITSLSGGKPPEPVTPEEPSSPSPPPPAIEELIPQGARADKDVAVRVLLSGEVTEMSMEKYLIGVVAAEMPAVFEQEALRAQAVAARTDTLYNMIVSPPSAKHPDADICGDYTCCMAYANDESLREKWGGDYLAYIGKIINAVISTDGIYMAYDNQPILAVFHSSSAGHTEDSGNVWLHSLPYLQSVKSPETAEQVPNFVSTVTISASDFKKTVQAEYPDAVFPDDEGQWITDVTHTESGRLNTLRIGGAEIAGTRLRSLFGLRSTAVSIEYKNGDFVLTTTGYGHGVGMSQYGANAMALAGHRFDEILPSYYTGITLIGPEEEDAL